MYWLHDPLTDRTVRIAAKRAERPNDFARDGAPSPCPFCAGSEASTPHEVDRVDDASGAWLTRVVPNRYPTVDGRDGVHEVVIESPRHERRFLGLSDEESTAAVTAWARRLAALRERDGVDYTLLFKNEGHEAGASMTHVHSQVMAFPEPPPIVGPMWERIAAAPERLGGETVARLGAWRVTSPPAPRGAYEAWLMPDEPCGPLCEEQAPEFAAALRRVLAAVAADAFNLVLQTPPASAPAAVRTLWWLEVIPRTSSIAGVELATGRWINTVPPDAAAAALGERLDAGG